MTHNHAARIVRFGLVCCFTAFGVAVGPKAAAAVEVVTQARDALPDAIRSAGVLRLATSLQWPPFDYSNEKGDPEGLDIELITLLSAKLGLKLEPTNLKFPAIVPGVTTGRFDVGMDQLARTAERQKVAQFVVYYRSELGLLVRDGVTDVDVHHLCGRTLALTQGSSQVATSQRLSDACVKDGKQAITFQFYPASADSYMAVSNGRGDGFLTDPAVGSYIAAHNDKLHMTRATLPETSDLAGIVIAKDNDQLAKAIRIALESAIQDGSYLQILKKYHADDGAVTLAELNSPAQ
jgi:polar amino acid transport system substrate-binding protein